jgi:DNA-binding NarL/FixJ family response regulator
MTRNFTPKELQVIECLFDGLSNKEIAGRVGTCQQTVKHHIRNISGKLDIDPAMFNIRVRIVFLLSLKEAA